MLTNDELTADLRKAVIQFWKTRSSQGKAQGNRSGLKDAGNRAMVTGGKQMDGFVSLFARLIENEGIPSSSIHVDHTTLPGYYRPEKDWDLVVVYEGRLVATIEFKSHVGPSFGNNFNNRVEEALGNATDLNTAYREGAFSPSPKPWLGYMMLLEEHPRSVTPVRLIIEASISRHSRNFRKHRIWIDTSFSAQGLCANGFTIQRALFPQMLIPDSKENTMSPLKNSPF